MFFMRLLEISLALVYLFVNVTMYDIIHNNRNKVNTIIALYMYIRGNTENIKQITITANILMPTLFQPILFHSMIYLFNY